MSFLTSFDLSSTFLKVQSSTSSMAPQILITLTIQIVLILLILRRMLTDWTTFTLTSIWTSICAPTDAGSRSFWSSAWQGTYGIKAVPAIVRSAHKLPRFRQPIYADQPPIYGPARGAAEVHGICMRASTCTTGVTELNTELPLKPEIKSKTKSLRPWLRTILWPCLPLPSYKVIAVASYEEPVIFCR